MYHLAIEPVSVHWKRRKRIESAINDFYEHRMLSPNIGSLPLNCGILY
jgi:hypothetical protein